MHNGLQASACGMLLFCSVALKISLLCFVLKAFASAQGTTLTIKITQAIMKAKIFIPANISASVTKPVYESGK